MREIRLVNFKRDDKYSRVRDIDKKELYMLDKNIDNNVNFLLDNVTQLRKKHEKDSNKQGKLFNIFKILKVGRNEYQTHSAFIYELLNENGLHGKKNTFLKLFMNDVLELDDQCIECKVVREDKTCEGRRIDLTVESNEHIIGIEIKIDADDQKGQLFDYWKELKRRSDKNGKEIKLFYLSLDGKDASKKSLQGSGKGDYIKDSDYTRISFEYEITDWINKCVKESSQENILREALIQYKTLIESLTGKNMLLNEEIACKIGSSQNNLQSAINISNALCLAKTNIQKKFWKCLLNHQKISDKNIKYYCKNKNIKSINRLIKKYYESTIHKPFGFKFEVCEYCEYKICIYVQLKHVVHYGLRLENSNGEIVANKKIKEHLRNLYGKGNAYADPNSNWISCYYYRDEYQQEINFYKFTKGASLLVDEAAMTSSVNSIANHIDELAKKDPKNIII